MTALRKEINYAIACVSEFAERHKLSKQEAFNYLYKYKGIEFLKENYEIEHTLSLDDALDDLFIICRNNGGTL
ncbi:DUF3791 domain-containing protein [Ruminococcus flavefaciens]|uniref:DUF3791 domain-containing protein n=1 Tax=Ruminococcus flavefaciens TaxID=1265 RepID=A0A1K1MH83_RUMFL|nr:DUF3791 domain-containing protein [Ruminococcus flavefaciens]SFW22496.1 Protein of unknown function [Ruminococcus flavefaciens]